MGAHVPPPERKTKVRDLVSFPLTNTLILCSLTVTMTPKGSREERSRLRRILWRAQLITNNPNAIPSITMLNPVNVPSSVHHPFNSMRFLSQIVGNVHRSKGRRERKLDLVGLHITHPQIPL
ncbi:hypothetical protein SDC9_84961 [bioreactor metagenome]|uniref:Uncharacterized protein n=1 Tax=bioreactor metagenome TaxID=1076179 RepID=A0A644ZBR2_9ZZZZ